MLPEGFSSPQGSNTAALESKLDLLIEQRTGKAEALPELTEVPEVGQTPVHVSHVCLRGRQAAVVEECTKCTTSRPLLCLLVESLIV